MKYRVDQPSDQGHELDTGQHLPKLGATSRHSEVFSNNYTDIPKYQSIIVLTDGCSNHLLAKTAICLLRYRSNHVAAVLDSSQAGKTTDVVFGIGGETPVIKSLAEAPAADALFLGIAPAGGILPKAWRPTICDAISRGLDVVSGLHEFLSDDEEFVSAAQASGCRLIDVRQNSHQEIATSAEFDPGCLRILTVGQDCSVGKMTVALEIEQYLLKHGHDARFLATGQTGIMIRGTGVPIDGVVADFVSGAVERLVLAHQKHEILLVEGQGSVTHPSFSGVTLGLLHGSAPQGMILCYEVGRDSLKGFPAIPCTPLLALKHLYEINAGVRHPSPVIGVAMNSQNVSEERADDERKLIEAELGLPVCDVFRHGPQILADAVLDLKFRLAMPGKKARTNGLPSPSIATK